ncbi:MAG: alanine--tRNA ligase [Alphaproteobacteria bacterium]|nr:alanine--tRNA ligase [Alphaproteobacteria bacterium]
MFSVNDIRAEFIKFFVENGHEHVASSSLVPNNDPTLMFTNAGMVQFKDTFTGKKVLPFRRATTAQKCLRAGGKHNDLENVGYTARHHTFFEMLGNFSFGDYFKEQVIEFAWKLVTQRLGLPKEKLLVTVHASDEEAAGLWRKISGLDDAKIIRIPTNDNFWSMGDTGPCGPCSEIFYDHGDKVQGGPPGSAEEDGDRFIEIWNLVFMQFETLPDGSRINLPKPSIDTGMGLERIAAVLQGVHSNYDIDLFQSIVGDVKALTNTDDPKFQSHYNVIADHLRAIAFMIADGITPSNEGRGYVLRRIVRRALRHGYMMGIHEPFLFKLLPSVKNAMGGYYTELVANEETTRRIVQNEEEGFMKTIDKGMSILQTELNKLGSSTVFPADVAYKLYDTYGFPFDLTQDILRNEGKRVDEAEFEHIATSQKALSKKAWIGTGDAFTDKVWFDIADKVGKVEFIRGGGDVASRVLAVVKETRSIEIAHEGDEIFVVAARTPFYAECGGQIGDVGTISSGCVLVEVVDTQLVAGVVVHKGVVKHGQLKVGDEVELRVDRSARLATSRNHTATHILQAALRTVLGAHVAQKGSLVTRDRLRFDFIHNETISEGQIERVENIVSSTIDAALDVSTQVMSLDDAKKSGALALFGEKYPDEVRVVTIGDNFSKELCGGEHVSNTSQIGVFKICSVSSVGSGIKRIEAVTAGGLRQYFERKVCEMSGKIETQTSNVKLLEKQIAALKAKSFSNDAKIQIEQVRDITFKHILVSDVDQKALLGLVDKEKAVAGQICFIIGNSNSSNGKMSLCVFVSQSLVSERFDAKALLSHLNEKLGLNIKFGGRADLAQCGGVSTELFEKCIAATREFVACL